MQVFISYKSEYRDFARELQQYLTTWGYVTWLDQDRILSGEYFRFALQQGLETSDVVIGIMTEEAMKSLEVLSEWDYAINNSRLVLLRYRDCKPLALYAVVQHIDFTKDEKSGLKQLEKTLSEIHTGTYKGPIEALQSSESNTQEKPKRNIRSLLLRQQELIWIQGVLNPVESEGKLISLQLDNVDKVLQHHRYGDFNLPADRTLAQVFDDVRGGMLILGKPGSGKTIALLQIARDLIKQALDSESAMDDEKNRAQLPVILNLSSWTAQALPIEQWVSNELKLRYKIPRRFAQSLVEHEQLILLLDGLDEVADDYRQACVKALNKFRVTYHYTKLLVCSRIEEYQALTEQLMLDAAVVLQALTPLQIQEILHRPEYSSLRKTLAENTVLAEFASNPFHLSLMMTAYQDMKQEQIELAEESLEARYQHLFKLYLEQQLNPTHVHHSFSPRQFRSYITWLAKGLHSKHETIFYIEDLQAAWLTKEQQFAYFIGRGLIFLVLAMFSTWLLVSSLGVQTGLAITVILNIIIGRILLSAQIVPVELALINIDWRAVSGVTLGVLMGAIAGLGFGLLLGVYRALNRNSDNPVTTALPIAVFLVLGLIVIALMNREFRQVSERTEQRIQPNHGMKRSLINGFVFAVLCGLIGLIIGLYFSFSLLGLVLGLLIGFIVFGGGAVIKHMLLRQILTIQGAIPLQYALFLRMAVQTRLLRQTGGGFMFIHRLLRDYLVNDLNKDKT